MFCSVVVSQVRGISIFSEAYYTFKKQNKTKYRAPSEGLSLFLGYRLPPMTEPASQNMLAEIRY